MALAAKPTQRGWLEAFFGRLMGWHSGLPPEQNSYTKLAVKLPLEGDDDVVLAADLYQPLAPKRNDDDAPAAVGTILVQSPYGRRPPMSIFLAQFWAARGYNVLFVSSRGTFGSGAPDRFDPGQTDHEDAIRVVRWMRKQPWYTGSFATLVCAPIYVTFFSISWELFADSLRLLFCGHIMMNG